MSPGEGSSINDNSFIYLITASELKNKNNKQSRSKFLYLLSTKEC